jgi:NitT/TauT family transport system permease protein
MAAARAGPPSPANRAGGGLLGRPERRRVPDPHLLQLLRHASILAYSLAFIAAVVAIETFLLQPIDRRLGRWRRA